MTTTTYAADRTALLIIVPYNDFMSEGGSSTRLSRKQPKRSASTTTCASWFLRSERRVYKSSSCRITRPGYKFHPRVDGVRRTRDRLSSVRFRDGRGSRSPPRRPGRGERASSSAAYRRRAKARRSCSVDSLAALHDCPRRASRASLARSNPAHPARDHSPLASRRIPRVLATSLSAVGTTADDACRAHPRDGGTQPTLGCRAHPWRAAQARHPRVQATDSAVHAPLSTPTRRPELVDVPAKPRDVGL